MNPGRLALQFALLPALFSVLTSRAENYQDWAAGCFTPAELSAGLGAPGGDHDGDSCPNIFEYLGGTLPKDRTSLLSLDFGIDHFLNEVTVSFPAASGRDDIDCVVMLSDDLLTWAEDAVLVGQGPTSTYHLNGRRYVKIGARAKSGVMIDSDGDGLSDFFEESLVRVDPGDGFTRIDQILPDDDFDGDGTPNIAEAANGPVPASFNRPVTLDCAFVADVLDHTAPPSPPALLVHSLLR